MATRKTTSKISKNVDFKFNIDKKSSKKANKKLKNTPIKTLFVALVVLLIGTILGGIPAYFLTRNDCFEIIGADELSLTLGERYVDEGVKVIAFGKNDAEKVKIETDMNINKDGSLTADNVGTYYIVYTVNNLKYGTIFKVQKIRLVTFVEPSEEENMPEDSENLKNAENQTAGNNDLTNLNKTLNFTAKEAIYG